MPNSRLVIITVALLVAAFAVHFWGTPQPEKVPPKPIDYLSLLREVEQDKGVASVTIERGENITIKYDATRKKSSTVKYPDERSLNQFIREAREQSIPVYVKNPQAESLWRELVIQIVPLLLFLLLLLVIVGRSTGGMGKLLKGSNFRQDESIEVKTTFADVAGLGEARDEVQEVVEFLENPAKFTKLGARVPRGVLFVGPPGTGKTLLARAAAGESGAAFFSLTGSDFVEMLAGLGANRVRDLFKKARAASPSIIFIDEIDAVGRARSSGSFGGNEEREQTLNQLLSEMDGFSLGEAIVVVAATNRPDILDPALMRPGRFDRQIMIGRPDVKGREAILHVHAKGKPIAPEDIPRIAQQTPGFTGAELANLLNEAALTAARRDLDHINKDCLDQAMLRVVAGLAREQVMSAEERTIVAYHEVGHALCAHYTSHSTPVQKISIVSRGQALGFTLSIPEQDRLLETKESLLDRLAMLLGGRAAELEQYGRATSGASNDLEVATTLAFQMVTRFGMSDRIGPRVIAGAEEGYAGQSSLQQLQCSPETASIIDREITEILAQADQRAQALIKHHKPELEELAILLEKEETIEQEAFLRVVTHHTRKK